jgi:PAS domain S-box-containing protein
MPEEAPATIVLVDDREANRYAAARILRHAHFNVVEAGTGAEALRLAADKPDLVILDVNLPDVNGLEVCRRIKESPETASVAVLHLSASLVGSENRSVGLECGADGYLTYPLDPRELVATVRALLRTRRAEQSLRAQHELLRTTLSSIGDAVAATDAAGKVTFLNPVAQELTGWSESEALGRPLSEVFRIVTEEGGQPIEGPVEQVIRSRQKGRLANTLLIGRDETRRPIDSTAAPIHDEGRLAGVVLVFRDVTERRRLEAELRQRNAELAEADRRKDEFLAMLAHELRNPLAPIRSALQVLRLKFSDEDEDVLRLRVMMERQVAHLVRLVDDLLDVSRITRGKLELRKERLELAAVVERAVESARPLLDERRHRLEVELTEPVLVEADPARLEQVLANLLNNAAKYTPPGGVVRLTARREGGEAVVRVRDTGIGIRPEMLPRLFDLFLQADRVPGRMAEGLGLGLALVRSLVLLHGGQVTASSGGPGQGSEFVVRLPVLAGPAPLRAEERAETSAGPGVRVLVVDDNTDGALSLALMLRCMGHEVRAVNDGPAALETVREWRPEVVFLDIGLPGMDGYEVARRMRREGGLAKALLVALTGYGQAEDRKRSREAELDQHLVKPASFEELQRLLAGRRGG